MEKRTKELVINALEGKIKGLESIVKKFDRGSDKKETVPKLRILLKEYKEALKNIEENF